MFTLAFDTSSKTAAVALFNNRELLYDVIVNVDVNHSEVLLPSIEHTLRTARVKITDIDLFACTLGPGSFTGLRIGISTLKGLVFATGKPAVGVSALEALALNVKARGNLISPVIDAGRGQVYTACYARNNDKLIPVSEEKVISPGDIYISGDKDIIFIGDGAVKYGDVIRNVNSKSTIAPSIHQFIRASAVAILGFEKFYRNEILDPSAVVPVYLRAADAKPGKSLY